ncbi:MAG: hypothetical protein NTZ67_04660 [Gammaproteobacteria bacterium]|nr:hypothetical protein [Gammaproteobacteria bacterium]
MREYFNPGYTVREDIITKVEAAEQAEKDKQWKIAQQDEVNRVEAGGSDASAESMATDNGKGSISNALQTEISPNWIVLKSARSLVVGVGAATADRALGHIFMNGSFPETAMAFFSAIGLQSISKFMLNMFGFLGAHEKALFPVFNIMVSLFLTGLEYIIRSASQLKIDQPQGSNDCVKYNARLLGSKIPFNKLPAHEKNNLLVHVPYLKFKSLTRREAVMFFLVAYGLQITNGVFAGYPDFQKDNKFASALDAFYQNAFLVFAGQIWLAVIADKFLFQAVPAVGRGFASGASATGSVVYSGGAALFAGVKKCCPGSADDKQTPLHNNKEPRYGAV